MATWNSIKIYNIKEVILDEIVRDSWIMSLLGHNLTFAKVKRVIN